jgi:hypothetical protein
LVDPKEEPSTIGVGERDHLGQQFIPGAFLNPTLSCGPWLDPALLRRQRDLEFDLCALRHLL